MSAAETRAREATALDAALGWLTVAAECIQRAAVCAAIGQLEMEQEYTRRRDELNAQVREATYDLSIARVILDRLAAERGEEPWAP